MTQAQVNAIRPRPLHEIAREIRRDWKNVYFGAKPYLEAMGSLNSINEDYGADSGKSIVSYFLANAQTWRGEAAKRVKAELKGMAKMKKCKLCGGQCGMEWSRRQSND